MAAPRLRSARLHGARTEASRYPQTMHAMARGRGVGIQRGGGKFKRIRMLSTLIAHSASHYYREALLNISPQPHAGRCAAGELRAEGSRDELPLDELP